LLACHPVGRSDPGFYFSGEGSFGFQIDAETGKVMFAIRNDGAPNKLMNGSVNIAVDISAAIGPVGGAPRVPLRLVSTSMLSLYPCSKDFSAEPQSGAGSSLRCSNRTKPITA
jgi:lipid-binding SYLF domain-containing protein